MSTLTIILITAGAILAGVGIGYYLRLIIALGKRRSIEIDIKQMMVSAKEEAQKIVDDAKKISETKLEELREEEKKKGHEFKETEKRLIKKDEFLDARQVELNREVEEVKAKVEEVKKIQERVSKVEEEKRAELERLSRLSEGEAKEDLNDIIAKGGDANWDMVNTDRLLKANGEKIKGKFVKSFEEDEIAAALGLTPEEAKKILG